LWDDDALKVDLGVDGPLVLQELVNHQPRSNGAPSPRDNVDKARPSRAPQSQERIESSSASSSNQ